MPIKIEKSFYESNIGLRADKKDSKVILKIDFYCGL